MEVKLFFHKFTEGQCPTSLGQRSRLVQNCNKTNHILHDFTHDPSKKNEAFSVISHF